MVSDNQSSHVNIDLNQVVQDVLVSVEDISDTNSTSAEDIPLHFDLNKDAPNEDMGGNVNLGVDQDGDQHIVDNIVDASSANRQEDANCTPIVGMVFESGEEFARFCHKYEYDKGFQFYIRSNRLLKEYREGGVIRLGVGEKEPKNHMMSRMRLVCKMGTKDRRKNKTGRKIASASPECKVYVDARHCDEGLVITQCELSHNHELFPDCSQLMVNYQGIDDGSYEQMTVNDSAGISLAKNYNSLVIARGGQENVTFSQQDLRNAVNLHRRRVIFGGDDDAVKQHFEKMTEANSEFYSAIQTDIEGKLLNVFWADARCRAQYRDFGDVVSFDTTFLCNKYQMPFAPFVGCNHHGSSIIFGAALVSHEDSDAFVWVFEQWLKCMGKPPKGIITDQCKAIGKAVLKVFPDVPHRLCLWHILQNANINLGKLKAFKDIKKDLKVVVYDSLSVHEFEDVWMDFVKKYKLEKNNWINDTYEIRHRWAPRFWQDTFWAGMSSTQCSDGQNRTIKGYVSLNTGLLQFMTQYEESIKKKVADEELNFITQSKPFGYDNSILAEVVFSKAYTNTKFLEVRDEVMALKHVNVLKRGNDASKIVYDAEEKIPIPIWKARHKSFKVSVDKVLGEFSCSCKLFEFCGILCRHIIGVIEKEDIDCIPLKYILDRWRKNVVRGYEGIKVSYYDPNESIKIKKQNEIQMRHNYLLTLALHNEEALQLYKKATDKIRATQESVLGIRSNIGLDGQDWSDPSANSVFGRRRLRPKDNNKEHAKPPEERNIKDPPDKRGCGRGQTTRNKHPSEKGARKRKKKDEQEQDHDDEGEAGEFGVANPLYGDQGSYYGVTPQYFNGSCSLEYVNYGSYDPRSVFGHNLLGPVNHSHHGQMNQGTTMNLRSAGRGDQRANNMNSQHGTQYRMSQQSTGRGDALSNTIQHSRHHGMSQQSDGIQHVHPMFLQ